MGKHASLDNKLILTSYQSTVLGNCGENTTPLHFRQEGKLAQTFQRTVASKYLHLFYFIFLNFFIFGCVGSSFLCEGFLQLRRAGATLHRSAGTSHRHCLSHCGAQAPDAQAQWLWLMGLVAPRHV